jgi:hypothetical protein
MRRVQFVTRPSRMGVHSHPMDFIYIVLGIVMFAVLLLMIEGIDRV